MFCPFCGTRNEENARFCVECGHPMQPPVQPSDAVEQPDGAVPLDAPSSDATIADATVADGTMPDGAAPAAGQRYTYETAPSPVSASSPIPAPSPVPPAPTAPPRQHVPTGREGGSGRSGTASGVWKIVVATVIVVALIIGGTAWYLHAKSAQDGAQTTQSQETKQTKRPKTTRKKAAAGKSDASKTDKDTDASRTNAKGAARTLDKQSTDAIVDGFSTTEVGVSVMTKDGLRSYSSRNASLSYVAAGLYLPAWIDYRDTYDQKPSEYADSLTGMNNDSANALVEKVGGESALNEWLNDNNYRRTRFERDYGDVQASQEGYENYSSPDDAARMLAEMAKTGDDGLMNYDIASEGVAIPSGATVHAHRGQGIKDSYNYFMVISNGSQKVAVAVMTQGQGKTAAAQLASRMLDKVWTTMLKG